VRLVTLEPRQDVPACGCSRTLHAETCGCQTVKAGPVHHGGGLGGEPHILDAVSPNLATMTRARADPHEDYLPCRRRGAPNKTLPLKDGRLGQLTLSGFSRTAKRGISSTLLDGRRSPPSSLHQVKVFSRQALLHPPYVQKKLSIADSSFRKVRWLVLDTQPVPQTTVLRGIMLGS
jgi:hypothetical protein